jgi:hypothetical protein
MKQKSSATARNSAPARLALVRIVATLLCIAPALSTGYPGYDSVIGTR